MICKIGICTKIICRKYDSYKHYWYLEMGPIGTPQSSRVDSQWLWLDNPIYSLSSDLPHPMVHTLLYKYDCYKPLKI